MNRSPRHARTALITGASAGIGRDVALEFAAQSFDVVLIARRLERLEALAYEVRNRFGVAAHVMTADLVDPAAPRHIFDEMASRHLVIDALVNNAGYEVPGFFYDTKWEEQRDFIQLMMTSVAELCHLFGPGMAARGYGRIANIASLAGFLPGTAGATLYTPSKTFVISMSEALWLEYREKNVHVVAICPGFTHTEFHEVAGIHDQLHEELPKFMWMDSKSVARQTYEAVMSGKKPVYVNGRINRLIALAAQLLPNALVQSLAAGPMRDDTPKSK